MRALPLSTPHPVLHCGYAFALITWDQHIELSTSSFSLLVEYAGELYSQQQCSCRQ
jgi:hypothetical protein